MELRSISDRFERMAAINLARSRAMSDTNETAAKEAADAHEELTHKAAEGIPRSWILIDEAHNYIPTTGIVHQRNH